MENTLIIKKGAAGDVVRTTSLLNVLDGRIYWITEEKNKPLLQEGNELVVLTLEEASDLLRQIKFARVISLEEDVECGRLAAEINTVELSGIYFKNNLNYTDSSASWFNMSKVSKLGLEKANKLKEGNSESYQAHIFRMIGKKFNGEPYKIFSDVQIKVRENLVGIERRTGSQWPDKQWWGYDALADRLRQDAVATRFLEHRNSMRDYLRDIVACSHIVSGDSLAMHVALAYGKTCTAIFNCTSPAEIHDYGLLKKVISPLLYEHFYASSCDKAVIESVPLADVYKTLPIPV